MNHSRQHCQSTAAAPGAEGLPVPSRVLRARSFSQDWPLFLIIILLLILIAPANAANVRLYFRNTFTGDLDTNYFIATKISSNILANGGVIAQGNPVRITPSASTALATNFFAVGFYAITNRNLQAAVVIRVDDNGPQLYDYTNLLYSGYNTYAFVYGSNSVPTFDQITNAIGGLVLTSTQVSNYVASVSNTVRQVGTTNVARLDNRTAGQTTLDGGSGPGSSAIVLSPASGGGWLQDVTGGTVMRWDPAGVYFGTGLPLHGNGYGLSNLALSTVTNSGTMGYSNASAFVPFVTNAAVTVSHTFSNTITANTTNLVSGTSNTLAVARINSTNDLNTVLRALINSTSNTITADTTNFVNGKSAALTNFTQIATNNLVMTNDTRSIDLRGTANRIRNLAVTNFSTGFGVYASDGTPRLLTSPSSDEIFLQSVIASVGYTGDGSGLTNLNVGSLTNVGTMSYSNASAFVPFVTNAAITVSHTFSNTITANTTNFVLGYVGSASNSITANTTNLVSGTSNTLAVARINSTNDLNTVLRALINSTSNSITANVTNMNTGTSNGLFSLIQSGASDTNKIANLNGIGTNTTLWNLTIRTQLTLLGVTGRVDTIGIVGTTLNIGSSNSGTNSSANSIAITAGSATNAGSVTIAAGDAGSQTNAGGSVTITAGGTGLGRGGNISIFPGWSDNGSTTNQGTNVFGRNYFGLLTWNHLVGTNRFDHPVAIGTNYPGANMLQVVGGSTALEGLSTTGATNQYHTFTNQFVGAKPLFLWNTNVIQVTNAGSAPANGTYQNVSSVLYTNKQFATWMTNISGVWYIKTNSTFNLYSSATSPANPTWTLVDGASPVPSSYFGGYMIHDGIEHRGWIQSTNLEARLAEVTLARSVTNLIWVSATGNDTTGVGSISSPYRTLTNAKQQAVRGQMIMVAPGTGFTNVQNLLKNGVNWEFMPGSFITNFITGNTNGGATNYAIFDDRTVSGSVTCSITAGPDAFQIHAGIATTNESYALIGCNSNWIGGILASTKSNNFINLKCPRVHYQAFYENSGGNAFGLFDGRVRLYVDDLVNQSYGTSVLVGFDDLDEAIYAPSGGVGVWWENGNSTYNGNNIIAGDNAIYCHTPNVGQGEIKPDRFDVTLNGIARSSNNIAIYVAATRSGEHNWTTWVDVKEATCDGAPAGYTVYNEGKHYFKAQKVRSAGGKAIEIGGDQGAAEIWLDVQKASAGSGGYGYHQTSNTVRGVIHEIFNEGGMVNSVLKSGGTNDLILTSTPTVAMSLSGNGTRIFIPPHKSTVNVTADNQILGMTTNRLFTLTSDSATATARTIVLTTGIDGAQIELTWGDTDAAEIVDDQANSGSGNVRLSATWTPTQYDTLRLIGVGNDWYELSRSAN